MKQVIYSGLNTKCIIFNLIYIDENDFDKERACSLFKWYLERNAISESNVGNFMMANANVISAHEETIVFGQETYKKHNCLFIYKLSSSDVRATFSTFTNRFRDRNIPEVIDNKPAPMLMSLKVITGTGNSYGLPLVRVDRNRELWLDWLSTYTERDNINLRPVIAISSNTNREKYIRDRYNWYGTEPQIEITVSLHDNLESSINDNRCWLSTYHITDGKHSIHAAPGAFNHKLTAHVVNNTLIIADNEKGYESIKDHIKDNVIREYSVINVNQYGIINSKRSVQHITSLDMGYSDYIRYPYKLLHLYMIDKNKLSAPNLKRNTSNLDLTVDFVPRTKKHSFRLQTYITPRNSGDGNNHLVIPYKKDSDIHIKALEFLSTFFTLNNTRNASVGEDYLTQCFLDNVPTTGDAMSEWFKECTANATTDEERLRQAYINLKQGLMKEYQEIGIYLAAHNMSNKKPIPSLILGKGLEHNPTKKISFDRVTRTYSTINYVNLPQPIYVQENRVKYLVKLDGKKGHILKGNVSYDALYDKTNNSIKLDVEDLFYKYMEEETERMR